MKDNSPFLSKETPRCPPALLKQAQDLAPARVAIARAGAELPMKAARLGTDHGIMTPVFVGEADHIRREADRIGWDVSGYDIIDADGEVESARAAALLGRNGTVDVVMKGQVHTDTFMSALISKDYGVRTGERLVHLFYISEPATGRSIVVSDAAVNVSPDIPTRQEAIRHAVRILRKTGTERPRIAILSATESAIPSVPSSMDGKELSEWATHTLPDCDVSGPLALDLILSTQSAATKGMSDNPVAGRADAVIVPDIVSGNVLFKSLVYLSGGCAAGVVLGGKVPILLTSRSDPAQSRLASIALAAVMRG